MNASDQLEIFLVAVPGLEDLLCAEAAEKGFRGPKAVKGGVTVQGGWAEVWRANLVLRGASRVLVRLGGFRAMHLSQLDKRARKFPWGSVLKADVPVRIEATCAKSRIYHSGAAAGRIARAIEEELGAPVTKDAQLRILVRIEDDFCTISADSSGEGLHKRGHKEAVNKAPLRETMAALFLRSCGFDGTEPVLDPMCGSGTFVIEAAEIAAGLDPGRTRSFAFEHLATFDAKVWSGMKGPSKGVRPQHRFYGSDRDQGAIDISRANAERAGVAAFTEFTRRSVSELVPPEGPPGLVIANPPYGARIGDREKLRALYASLGRTLKERFAGWRVGMVTNDAHLAKATGLQFAQTSGPVSHGGIKVRLYVTTPLA